MIYVYVLQSTKLKYRYVGITDNIDRRIKQHSLGHSKSTKPYAPFQIILQEKYINYKEARKREIFLKSGAGRKFLDSLK